MGHGCGVAEAAEANAHGLDLSLATCGRTSATGLHGTTRRPWGLGCVPEAVNRDAHGDDNDDEEGDGDGDGDTRRETRNARSRFGQRAWDPRSWLPAAI